MRNTIAYSSIVMLIACALVRADVATTAPSDEGFTLSPPRVAKLAPCAYYYTSAQTTYDKGGMVAGQLTGEVKSAMANSRTEPVGGPIFVYKDSGIDPAKPFTLQVGFPVANGTEPVGTFQVGQLDSVRALTALYSGPVSKIGQAYARSFARLKELGEQPSGERRERFFYWEGPESPNNVIQIEIGLREGP